MLSARAPAAALSPRSIARAIVAREGGYVNDPDDPGGATKYGVTIGTMKRLRMDLTGDGVVTIADVKALTREDAEDIFLKHYFERPRIDDLPKSIQASVFDMYVNSGRNAVKILQRLLNKMGFSVAVDGALGPQTIGAAKSADRQAGRYFVNAYGIERRNYYYRLADRRPRSRKYATTRVGGKGGWIRRAEEFMDPQYRLTEAQHRERVRAWG